VKQARRQSERRRRLLTGAFSALVHGAAIAALFLVHADEPQPMAEIEPIPVTLVAPVKPPEPPAPPKPTPEPPAAPAKPPPSLHARPPRNPPPPEASPLLVAKGRAGQELAELSDAEVAGASTADSGGGGGECNMTRWLQGRLRNDPLVQAALAEARPKRPLLVWNGSWVRHGEQEGAGLAAVREAIMWEVGFAPIACRAEPVHGLVLISLNDTPGGARVALGRADWRWSDLLSVSRR
jgi:hypothetical protein